MKKVMSIVLALVLTVALAACGTTASSSSAAPPATSAAPAASSASTAGSESTSKATSGEQLKVAMVMSGPINDKGWNAEAYLGLTMIEKELGADIAFTENVAAADFEEVYRGYADLGYNMIIGHGFEFGDPATAIAPNYPDTYFVVTSSDITQEPNVVSLQNRTDHQGYLAGALAALETKSGIVGAVGGGEIPSIIGFIEGFKQGAAYVDPEVKVLSNYTGDFNDAAPAKQMAEAMIKEGADVMTHDANAAGMGVFEAVKEATGEVWMIGAIDDQYEVLPERTMTSSMSKLSDSILAAAKLMQEGNLEPMAYQFGVKEGSVRLADFRDYPISEESKAKLAEIEEKLANGEITIEIAK